MLTVDFLLWEQFFLWESDEQFRRRLCQVVLRIGVWPGGLLWEVLSILTCGGLGLDSQVGGTDMFHGVG